jgi:hypothetical protein
MRILIAKNARLKHPSFPFSYAKICKIADKLKIDKLRISHSENINDLVVKVHGNISTDTLINLINLLNVEYKEADFEIWK